MHFRFSMLLIVMMALLSLGACGTAKEVKAPEQESAESLFDQALDAMDKELYLEATRLFEEVERQHPYDQLATRAQLMASFASYQDARYDDAILSLNRFISLHPGNQDIDYAYYMKALCYYDQISDVRRDQDMTLLAQDALETLITRFPKSDYRRDAQLKLDLTRDHLAGKEMEIGRYYLNRDFVNAAINRFRSVITDYQTTTHVAEALHRLVECYLTLGLRDEALRVASVLGYNYPGSIWYERSYQLLDDQARKEIVENRGFWDKTVDSLFKPD